EQRFTTGSVRHKTDFGVRVMHDQARRKLSTGSFPTAESGDLLTDDTTSIIGIAGWVEDQIALSRSVVVTPAFRVEHSNSSKTIHRLTDDTGAPHDVDITGGSSATGVMPGLGLAVGRPALSGFSSFYLGYSAPRVSQAITPDGHDANLHAERS